MLVYISPTNIPGLVNVVTATGQTYNDLNLGQVRYLAEKQGWVPVPPRAASPAEIRLA